MHGHRRLRTYALASVLVLYACAAFAEPKIGNATATKNKVEGVLNGSTQDLANGSEVFANEIVRTGPASVADLLFIDSSKLSVGPTSEIRLDKFVYNPVNSTGTVVFQATRGAFRFVTGAQAKKNYEIKTPFGTLGVRG